MSQVLLEKRDGFAIVTLNRPEAMNALSRDLRKDFVGVFEDCCNDPAIRVLILTGNGKAFCAGADLRDMATARSRLAEDPTALVEINAVFGELCVAYASTGLATVAVLEGTVMGGGLGLACVVDVALAGSGAVFRLPETSLGVVPAQIAPFLVERLGYAEAKRLADVLFTVQDGRVRSVAA